MVKKIRGSLYRLTNVCEPVVHHVLKKVFSVFHFGQNFWSADVSSWNFVKERRSRPTPTVSDSEQPASGIFLANHCRESEKLKKPA